MSRVHAIAAGTISPDCITLTAPSRYDARQTVEHRVAHWHGDCYVAEVRVDLRLTQRSTFTGPDAQADALAWCAAIAPHDLAVLIRENERRRAAVAAERANLAAAFEAPAPRVLPTVKPVEVAPASWADARDAVEARCGVGLWRFFHFAQ